MLWLPGQEMKSRSYSWTPMLVGRNFNEDQREAGRRHREHKVSRGCAHPPRILPDAFGQGAAPSWPCSPHSQLRASVSGPGILAFFGVEPQWVFKGLDTIGLNPKQNTSKRKDKVMKVILSLNSQMDFSPTLQYLRTTFSCLRFLHPKISSAYNLGGIFF